MLVVLLALTLQLKVVFLVFSALALQFKVMLFVFFALTLKFLVLLILPRLILYLLAGKVFCGRLNVMRKRLRILIQLMQIPVGILQPIGHHQRHGLAHRTRKPCGNAREQDRFVLDFRDVRHRFICLVERVGRQVDLLLRVSKLKKTGLYTLGTLRSLFSGLYFRRQFTDSLQNGRGLFPCKERQSVIVHLPDLLFDVRRQLYDVICHH